MTYKKFNHATQFIIQLFKAQPTEQTPVDNFDDMEEDWGLAEQNAYIRMKESRNQNISSEVFLDWLSKLEQEQMF